MSFLVLFRLAARNVGKQGRIRHRSRSMQAHIQNSDCWTTIRDLTLKKVQPNRDKLEINTV